MNKKITFVLLHFFILTGCSESMPKLGIGNGQLMQCPDTPNCVNSQAADEKHFIQPIQFVGTSLEAQKRLLEILNEWDHAKVIITNRNYIRAEFVSKVFRFVDDVEFYFPETEDKEITIHVRSASRTGYSDLGVNQKRIELVRSKLKQNSHQ